MLALLTNDDGIFARPCGHGAGDAPDLRGLRGRTVHRAERGRPRDHISDPADRQGDLRGGRSRGWAVDGSPADSVKLGISQFCPRRPDVVISGINGGLNAGINVLYSGTVAAAIEGAFFGITSIAVSLEYDEHAEFDRAAEIGVEVISELIARRPPAGSLYNINIPTRALAGRPQLRVVPMSTVRYGEAFERRVDPRGRAYYWATNDPPPLPRPSSRT